MTRERIDEYAYLWDGSQPGWALLRVTPGQDEYAICNEDGQAMLLIEDEHLHVAVVKAMQAAGTRILEHVTPGPVEVTPMPPSRKR